MGRTRFVRWDKWTPWVRPGCSFVGAGSGGSRPRCAPTRFVRTPRRGGLRFSSATAPCCYAAGWQVVFALVGVVSDPENVPGRTRWGWRFGLRAAVRAVRPPRGAARRGGRRVPAQPRPALVHPPDRRAVRARARRDPRSRAVAVRDDVRRIVEQGYDAMADRFAEWQKQIIGSTRLERDRRAARAACRRDRTSSSSASAPACARRAMLAERGRLTGVDVSGEQLRRARRTPAGRDPDARGLHASSSSIPPRSTPSSPPTSSTTSRRRSSARSCARSRAGSARAATSSRRSRPRTTPAGPGEWLGVEMFFAGLPPAKNRSLVEARASRSSSDEIEVSHRARGRGAVPVAARAPSRVASRGRAKEIAKVGVVGLGTMGAGIAQLAWRPASRRSGARSRPSSASGRATGSRTSSTRKVEKGTARARRDRDAAVGRLTLTTEVADLADCDLVIEAIVEELEPKQELFAELDRDHGGGRDPGDEHVGTLGDADRRRGRRGPSAWSACTSSTRRRCCRSSR